MTRRNLVNRESEACISGSLESQLDPDVIVAYCEAAISGHVFADPKHSETTNDPTRENRSAVANMLRVKCWKMAAEYSFEQLASDIVSELETQMEKCDRKTSSLELVQVYLAEAGLKIAMLRELYRGRYYGTKPSKSTFRDAIQSVANAFLVLYRAFHERKRRSSPQAKYGEAQLSARRAMKVNPDPFLDPLQGIVDLLNERCSRRIYEYAVKEVGLSLGDFLDAMHMIAMNRMDCEKIPNPPAYVRSAVSRKQMRIERRYSQRTTRLTGEIADCRLEMRDIDVALDLNRGMRELGLSADQKTVIEMRFQGRGTQGSDAADYLGWNPTRLERTRRSLATDRPAGKRLRDQFEHYNSARKKPSKLS